MTRGKTKTEKKLPIKTIIAPAGKSDPSFDLQADIIFGGNGGARIKSTN